MKKIFFLFLLLISINSFAQDVILDVIYFKNGNILKGVITELIPGTSLKITDRNGKDFTFQMKDIDRIEKENFDKKDFTNRDKYDSIRTSQNKFTNLTKLGVVRNISDYKNNVTFANIFSFQISQFAIGIGGSYIKYVDEYTVPVYLDARYTFAASKQKPYFYLDLGHSVSDEKGKGIYFQAGTGLRVSLNNTISLIFDAAYSYQKVKYNVQSYTVIEYRDNLHICTGVQF